MQYIYSKTLIEQVDTELYTGFCPVLRDDQKIQEVSKVPFIWNGVRFPLTLLLKIVSFFTEVMKKHDKGEAQVRLYYNKTAKEPWEVLVNRQKVSGARTEELEHCTLPGVEVGTIHSHPTFGASQSGTDQQNEAPTNGIHLTIGNLDSSRLSWDFRAYLQGIKHDRILSLFDLGLPAHLEFLTEEALKELKQICAKFPEAPKEWLDKIEKEPVYTPAVHGSTGFTPHTGGWNYSKCDYHSIDNNTQPLPSQITQEDTREYLADRIIQNIEEDPEEDAEIFLDYIRDIPNLEWEKILKEQNTTKSATKAPLQKYLWAQVSNRGFTTVRFQAALDLVEEALDTENEWDIQSDTGLRRLFDLAMCT